MVSHLILGTNWWMDAYLNLKVKPTYNMVSCWLL